MLGKVSKNTEPLDACTALGRQLSTFLKILSSTSGLYWRSMRVSQGERFFFAGLDIVRSYRHNEKKAFSAFVLAARIVEGLSMIAMRVLGDIF